MQTIYFNKINMDIQCVSDVLEQNGIVGFPTETVYGLGALISKDKAIEKIYRLKARPAEKALTIHIGNINQVHLVADEIPDDFFILAKCFLPGPLTIVLKKKEGVSPLISSLDTIAIRIPSHPLSLKLLKGLKSPIIGTSANISSYPSPVTADEVSNNFHNKIECIIDGGPCDKGIPSTVISIVDEIKILREGSITKEQIESALNKKAYIS